MDNQAHNKIKDLLSQHNQIGVVLSRNPQVDHAAAGLALYLALRQMGKQIVVASPTPPTVEISNLVGIDKVKNTLGTDGADLTVAFPYKDGEIEKVSYTLENGYLNIVVKAGDKGLSFQDKDIQFKRAEGKVPPLMFFVGVARLTDLGNMFNPDAFKDTTIVNIDNRPDNQGFGDVIMVSPKFSSVSEQVAHLISQIEAIEIDQDMAQNLLSGISHATNDFQEAKTSYLAFEMAGVLMRKGATRQRSTQKEEKQESNASFFPYQPQRSQSVQQQRPQQFPRPSFPKPFQQSQSQNQSTQTQQKPLQDNSSQPQRQAPSDWLTPKVYKGSTVL
ncbi:MAG TPA: hypothetical protein VLF89_09480 [Candidatus Saccharimonadales bacterium]|nr:hypothetical protein [Candidatus Saccharimonadales bacterium]